jgi:hypothetical protein
MKDEKSGSVVDSPLPEPVTAPADSTSLRTKKIVKYSISFALVWFIVHWWFILPRQYTFVGGPSSHASACAHGKYAWVMDAYAPKAPEVPLGRLAENFFLYVFRLRIYRGNADVQHTAPYRTRPMQSQRLANMRGSLISQVRTGTYALPSTSSIFSKTSSPSRKAPTIPSTLLGRLPRVTLHSLSRI